jgi:phenylacetate-CoA ligase
MINADTCQIWDREHETMPREDLRALQLARLQRKVTEVYYMVPFYRQLFDAKGVKPWDICSLEDLRLLPFTVKQDFRDNYPFGLLAVPMSQVTSIHASSGTTGKPTVVGYTQNDVNLWADMIARALTSAGATRHDVVHNAHGYGLFTGGLGFHFGALRIGATVVPVSGGNTKRQIMLMRDLGSTVLICTPSYSLFMAETAAEMGIDLRESKLRIGVFGAEPWSERMRREIEAKVGLKAVDSYGLSEIIGPGVAIECPHRTGLHIFEDHFLPEIIDPVTGEPLPLGEKGELVITTLTKEALPVIRYRTRDISSLDPEPCPCGRTLIRMSKVTGRTDDMLVIRGVNVFPSQIESVLLEVEGIEPHYQIIVDRQHNLDEMEVWVEVSEALFTDEYRQLEDLSRRVSAGIDSVLGIRAKVKLVEPRSIERSEGKARRVIDRREI